jgi:hypothetical protein
MQTLATALKQQLQYDMRQRPTPPYIGEETPVIGQGIGNFNRAFDAFIALKRYPHATPKVINLVQARLRQHLWEEVFHAADSGKVQEVKDWLDQAHMDLLHTDLDKLEDHFHWLEIAVEHARIRILKHKIQEIAHYLSLHDLINANHVIIQNQKQFPLEKLNLHLHGDGPDSPLHLWQTLVAPELPQTTPYRILSDFGEMLRILTYTRSRKHSHARDTSDLFAPPLKRSPFLPKASSFQMQPQPSPPYSPWPTHAIQVPPFSPPLY